MTEHGIQMMLLQDPLRGRLLVCQVDNSCVTSHQASKLAEAFRMLGDTAEHLSTNAGKLLIGIDGYDKDPRELYEIDEVRSFIQSLAAEIPWWFALLHPSLSLTWICCMVQKPVVRRGSGGEIMLKYDRPAVEHALQEAIAAVAERTQECSMPADDIETVLQNLTITAGDIKRGLNPADADPFISKALSEYHQQRR